MKAALIGAAALVLSGFVGDTRLSAKPFEAGARYVAMGSSYAAGAGVGPLVPGSPKRCGRTLNNYAHLLAAKMGLDLIDVSCGGATTAHILGPWSELPPQVEAVTPDTRLVTVTIGGNDLNYVRNLMIATCGWPPNRGQACPKIVWPGAADYKALDEHLRHIAREVRRRAPQARLVFVDYVRILPERGSCAPVQLDKLQMAAARETFRRLAEVTKTAARAEGAILVSASQLSKGHDACSAEPWGSGHPGKPIDWHPTAEGHKAIAAALEARLK